MYSLGCITFVSFEDMVNYVEDTYKIEWAYERSWNDLTEEEKQEACFELNYIIESKVS